jgi:hypothetical protein
VRFLRRDIVTGQTGTLEVVTTALSNVRFGSKADIGARPIDVRFYPQKQTLRSATGMSALCKPSRTTLKLSWKAALNEEGLVGGPPLQRAVTVQTATAVNRTVSVPKSTN